MSGAAEGRIARSPQFRSERPRHEIARVLRRRPRLRAGIVQLLSLAVAVGLAFLTPRVDVGFQIAANRTIDMLVAVGAGTVTFIGIVFSLLFLVVQFGSTTFTPRLNLFRNAPIVWRAFAVYTGVVIYAFTAVLVISRDEETSGLVAITAFLGVLISLAVYRRLQFGAFASIQLSSALAQVARRGREIIDALYPPDGQDPAPAAAPGSDQPVDRADGHALEITWPGRARILQAINVPRAFRAAERTQSTVTFRVGPGDRIEEGSVVAVVSGAPEPGVTRDVMKALTVGDERTFEQDSALPFRVLADIALRALSPAVNDPTTAVQALDEMDGLLRVVAIRNLDVGRIADGDGVLRVTLDLPTWDDYLSTALDEIIALRPPSPNVTRRLCRLLDDLDAVVTSDRHRSLEVRRRLVAVEPHHGGAE
jgi:uncharacterized membrane protein